MLNWVNARLVLSIQRATPFVAVTICHLFDAAKKYPMVVNYYVADAVPRAACSRAVILIMFMHGDGLCSAGL